MKSMGYRTKQGQASYDLPVLLVVVAAERTLFLFVGQLSYLESPFQCAQMYSSVAEHWYCYCIVETTRESKICP